MPIKDILCPLTSYPVATPLTAIENAISLAYSLGARMTAMVNEMEVSPAAGALLRRQDVDAIVNAEFEKNHRLARDVVASFERAANAAGIAHDHVIVRCMPADFPPRLVKEARLRDLSVVAIDGVGAERRIAETLIFEAGRPVLIFPAEPSRELARPMVNIALAWDFSGPAARAVAEGFPLLERARTLRILTVVDEKTIDARECSTTISNYLARHGLKAVSDEVKSAGRSMGRVFAEYVEEHHIDLLVMGAYGHSKFREFVLGGATRSMIASPPTWVLLSH
jgi:nucleotide-binding universal stress UspA family protein